MLELIFFKNLHPIGEGNKKRTASQNEYYTKRASIKYEEEKEDKEITSLGGLPLHLDLAHTIGLFRSVREHIQIREATQGSTDTQVIISLILLNLAGGDCVEDLGVLVAEELIHWHRQRCGKSEEAHGMMKNLVLREGNGRRR